MDCWNDGIFPRKSDYSRICPTNGQTNDFQTLCENLSLIRRLRILFFFGEWHILKWEGKLYLSKSEWVTALKMFKECENVEAIQLMNHAKAFDGSQLFTAVSFEGKNKEVLPGLIYLNNSLISVELPLCFSSCALFLNLPLLEKKSLLNFLHLYQIDFHGGGGHWMDITSYSLMWPTHPIHCSYCVLCDFENYLQNCEWNIRSFKDLKVEEKFFHWTASRARE